MESLFKTKKLRFAMVFFLTAACVVTSYFQCDWIYLQKSNDNAVSAAKSYSDLDCIIINTGINFWNHTLYFEAKNYQSVTFLSDTPRLNYSVTQAFHEKPVIVYIMNIIENQDAVLQEIIRQNPFYSQYTSLPASAYSKGYLLE